MNSKLEAGSNATLPRLLECPPQAINEIIKGKKEITPQTAIKFVEAFGTSAQLWLGLEQSFRLFQAREQASSTPNQVARRSHLYELAPIGELQKRGWLPAKANLEQLKLERAIPELLDLSATLDGVLETPAFLKSFGVHFVIVPCLAKCHIDGAAFWFDDEPAFRLLIMTLVIPRFNARFVLGIQSCATKFDLIAWMESTVDPLAVHVFLNGFLANMNL